MFVFFWYDRFLQKKKMQRKAWAQREEFRRLSLACLGGTIIRNVAVLAGEMQSFLDSNILDADTSLQGAECKA